MLVQFYARTGHCKYTSFYSEYIATGLFSYATSNLIFSTHSHNAYTFIHHSDFFFFLTLSFWLCVRVYCTPSLWKYVPFLLILRSRAIISVFFLRTLGFCPKCISWQCISLYDLWNFSFIIHGIFYMDYLFFMLFFFSFFFHFVFCFNQLAVCTECR